MRSILKKVRSFVNNHHGYILLGILIVIYLK